MRRALTASATGGDNRDKMLQAVVIKAMQSRLADGEQMLGVTVCRLAGGLRGRLELGISGAGLTHCALMLTDQRLVLHRYPITSAAPQQTRDVYAFPIASITALDHEEIETYGGEPSCRIVVRLANDSACRLRIRGQWRCTAAYDICRVFAAIAPVSGNPVIIRRCPNCSQRLDGNHRYCPYCGTRLKQQEEDLGPAAASADGIGTEPLNENREYGWPTL